MLELRRSPRYPTRASASIPGVMEGENPIKDLSITGCCIESASHTGQAGVQYQLQIEPEKAAHIGNFQLLVEQKWVHTGENSTEIGFIIIASPKGKQFQHYIDYLAYRNSNL